MTHLDLSGIRAFNRESITAIVEELSTPKLSTNLLALHLNDLGINDDDLFHENITELFDIHPENLNAKADLFVAIKTFVKVMRGPNYIKELVDNINYIEVIENTINMKPA